MLKGQLQLAALFARELFAREHASRAPNPTMLLGTDAILAAMDDGGAIDGRTAAGYLYHSARISRSIAGCATCVDFGCGSAVQLLQVAGLNPDIRFTGVDHEPAMLKRAAARASARGITNVEWICDDIVAPKALQARRFDAALSTMTLHDLPNLEAVRACLRNMHQVTNGNGAIYIEDFARLKSRRSMEYFVGLHAPAEPDAFSALYRASLGAAFTRNELGSAAAALPQARFYATFPVPFLVVIKTADRAVPIAAHDDLRALRSALEPWQRRDLDALHRSFRLGGLRGDPFP